MKQPEYRSLMVLRTLAIVLGFAVAGPVLAQGTMAKAEPTARKDMVLSGDAKCTRCHDENEEYPVLAIGKTKHGTLADKRTPTCTSCHGESETHMNKPEGVKERPAPGRAFSKNAKTPVEDRTATCLTCHQGNHQNWQSSTHAARDVTCTSCHKVHASHDKVRDKVAQTEVCFACHKEQRAQLNRVSRHPLQEGKMSCASCHNVHGDNPKQMARPTVNEVCYACHMEKRGPFVHNHQPVSEDCTICHNPHGTVVNSLLKKRPPFLCQDCHSHSSHPGQTPGLPTAATTSTSQLGTVGRGCLSCHTNIHGGNSTVNSATAGRFRR